MKSLDEIAVECGTDKATVFTRTYAKPHCYTPHLEVFFAPMRDKPIRLLEIGIGGGESVRTWLEYFTAAEIHGIDFVQDTNIWNTPKGKPHERYTFCHGDQSCSTFWACFLANHGDQKWDVIIDDGSHLSADIMKTFEIMWPHVAPGGIYEIEDLGVAPETFPWLIDFVAAQSSGVGDKASITFAKELVIIKKANV
jgi:demethylmacrocin O-methyltransferase